MDRPYILFRALQTIYEVTGYSLTEDSVLDFDHEYDLPEIESRLLDEFCIVGEPPNCFTVEELVNYLCKGVGLDDEG